MYVGYYVNILFKMSQASCAPVFCKLTITIELTVTNAGLLAYYVHKVKVSTPYFAKPKDIIANLGCDLSLQTGKHKYNLH